MRFLAILAILLTGTAYAQCLTCPQQQSFVVPEVRVDVQQAPMQQQPTQQTFQIPLEIQVRAVTQQQPVVRQMPIVWQYNGWYPGRAVQRWRWSRWQPVIIW